MRLTYLALALLLVPGVVMAYGYADALENGTALPGYNAVGISLGGARAVGFGDALSILTNPADIYRIPGTSMNVSVGPAVLKESFEDSTGYNYYNWLALSTLSAAVKTEISPRLSLGLGLARISDYSFDGTYYVSDGFAPGITKSYRVNSTGGLFEAAAGFSWRALRLLNLGLSAGIRFGEMNYDSVYSDRIDPSNDTTVSSSWREDQFAWHAGMMIPLGMTSIGISWGSATDHFHSRLAAGVLLYTGETRQAALGVEAELVDPGGDDDLEVRFLGRISPSASAVFRGAISYSDIRRELEAQGLGLSFGSGISFGRFTIEGAFAWSSITRDSGSFSVHDPFNVDLSRSILSFGLNWNL